MEKEKYFLCQKRGKREMVQRGVEKEKKDIERKENEKDGRKKRMRSREKNRKVIG